MACLLRRVRARLPAAAQARWPGGQVLGGGFRGRGGGILGDGTAPGRLLATQLKSGKKSVPLGIDAGGVALPLGIKRIELRAIFGRGGIGPGDAVIIQGQVNPVGHDGHRTYDFRAFVYPWQPEWR